VPLISRRAGSIRTAASPFAIALPPALTRTLAGAPSGKVRRPAPLRRAAASSTPIGCGVSGFSFTR
jgi:hypothetical protein